MKPERRQEPKTKRDLERSDGEREQGRPRGTTTTKEGSDEVDELRNGVNEHGEKG